MCRRLVFCSFFSGLLALGSWLLGNQCSPRAQSEEPRANPLRTQSPHQFLKMLPSMLKVSVLIKTGAGRRKQDRLSFARVPLRPLDGALHVSHFHDLRRAFERRSDPVGSGSDGQHRANTRADEIAHLLELAGLVLAAENENHALW